MSAEDRLRAMAMDCSPDEQNRLIVAAGTSTGSRPAGAASRATFSPCAASGIAHPHSTSSIDAGIDARTLYRLLHDARREVDGVHGGERAVGLPSRDGGARH